jgi:hypothetical protein
MHFVLIVFPSLTSSPPSQWRMLCLNLALTHGLNVALRHFALIVFPSHTSSPTSQWHCPTQHSCTVLT